MERGGSPSPVLPGSRRCPEEDAGSPNCPDPHRVPLVSGHSPHITQGTSALAGGLALASPGLQVQRGSAPGLRNLRAACVEASSPRPRWRWGRERPRDQPTPLGASLEHRVLSRGGWNSAGVTHTCPGTGPALPPARSPPGDPGGGAAGLASLLAEPGFPTATRPQTAWEQSPRPTGAAPVCAFGGALPAGPEALRAAPWRGPSGPLMPAVPSFPSGRRGVLNCPQPWLWARPGGIGTGRGTCQGLCSPSCHLPLAAGRPRKPGKLSVPVWAPSGRSAAVVSPCTQLWAAPGGHQPAETGGWAEQGPGFEGRCCGAPRVLRQPVGLFWPCPVGRHRRPCPPATPHVGV